MLKSKIKVVTDAKKPDVLNYAICKVHEFRELLTTPISALATVQYYAEDDAGVQTELGQYPSTLTEEQLNGLYAQLTPDLTKPYSG